MSAITFDLPDDLADQLRALADRLPRVLDGEGPGVKVAKKIREARNSGRARVDTSP